eukprot:9171348-Lingulodinium_polyedra.AAC.1
MGGGGRPRAFGGPADSQPRGRPPGRGGRRHPARGVRRQRGGRRGRGKGRGGVASGRQPGLPRQGHGRPR